jgi:hypothetical protein
MDPGDKEKRRITANVTRPIKGFIESPSSRIKEFR